MEKEKKAKHGKGAEKPQKVPVIVGTRGRIFSGFVIKKFPNRVVVEFERVIYVPKYERFYKKKTRIHARLPEGIDVNVGDFVKVRECRPLSKIIHHLVIERIKSSGNSGRQLHETSHSHQGGSKK